MTVYYQEAGGLVVDDPVEFRDMDVGSVKNVELVGENADSVAVLIKFDDPQFKVHCSSQFLLTTAGLMGGMKIDITPPMDSSTCYLKKGAKLSGVSQVDFIEMMLTNLHIDGSNELGIRMKELFQDSSKKHLFKGLKNLFSDINAVSFPVQQNIGVMKTQIQDLKVEMDSLKEFFKQSAASPIIQELKRQYKSKSGTLDSLKFQLKHLENQSKALKTSSTKLKADFNKSMHEYQELIRRMKAVLDKDSTKM